MMRVNEFLKKFLRKSCDQLIIVDPVKGKLGASIFSIKFCLFKSSWNKESKDFVVITINQDKKSI